MTLQMALGLAFLAGLSIPLGAIVSSNVHLRSMCLRLELDSFMSYFSGGALLAAIALILIPRGMEYLSVYLAAITFSLGGIIAWMFSAWADRTENNLAIFISMALDFVPEAILLGVAVAHGSNIVYLLMVLIALQNMPESFAAYHEMKESGTKASKMWTLFIFVALLGPVSAWLGFAYFTTNIQLLGSVLLFCSGAILYLIFEAIAPRAHLNNSEFPAIGSIAGFLIGLIGTMVLH